MMGDEDSSSSPSIPSDLHAILEAQKNVFDLIRSKYADSGPAKQFA